MRLHVTKEAAQWYKDEMDLKEDDFLRLFVRVYGGHPDVHPNFSLGVSKESPRAMAISHQCEGITFYLSEEDEWFLEKHHLSLTLSNDEVDFIFTPISQ